MKVSELMEKLQAFSKNNPMDLDDEVVIPAIGYRDGIRIGTIGPSDYVNLNGIQIGFDWNRGRLFLIPEIELRYEKTKIKKE